MRRALAAVLALASAGCFSKPDFNATADAAPDSDAAMDQAVGGPETSVAVRGIASFPLSSNTPTKVPYADEAHDDLGEFDPSTNRFTAAAAGDYLVCASLTITTSVFELYLKTNGGAVEQAFARGSVVARGCHAIRLAAGDDLEVFIKQTVGGDVMVLNNASWDWLTIRRMPISVAARTQSVFGLQPGTFARVPYSFAVHDDGMAYDKAQSRFVAMQPGDFLVCASLWFGPNAAKGELDVYVSGVRTAAIAHGGLAATGCRSVRLAANQYVEVWAAQFSASAVAIAHDPLWNWVTIQPQPMSAAATLAAQFELPNNENTLVPFTAEQFDVNNKLGEGRFAVETAGDYLVCAAFDHSQVHPVEIDVHQNDTRLVGLAYDRGPQTGCWVLRFAASDLIAIHALQESGSNDTIMPDAYRHWFQVGML